jgi:hypothetical protein
MLSETAVAFLSPLTFKANAKREASLIPLGGIYWDDEIPDFDLLLALPEQDHKLVFRLFSIRFTLWAGEALSESAQAFLDEARSQVPAYPLFQRLNLSPADRKAQEEAERSALESFDALFGRADKIKVSKEGDGFSVSASFDLRKEPAPAARRPWWKRLWTRN